MKHVYVSVKVIKKGKKRYKREYGLMEVDVWREAEIMFLEVHGYVWAEARVGLWAITQQYKQ